MEKAGFPEEKIDYLLRQYFDFMDGEIPKNITKLLPKTIKFGTAGVRDLLGEDFDFVKVVIVTQAIADSIDKIAKTQNIISQNREKCLFLFSVCQFVMIDNVF